MDSPHVFGHAAAGTFFFLWSLVTLIRLALLSAAAAFVHPDLAPCNLRHQGLALTPRLIAAGILEAIGGVINDHAVSGMLRQSAHTTLYFAFEGRAATNSLHANDMPRRTRCEVQATKNVLLITLTRAHSAPPQSA